MKLALSNPGIPDGTTDPLSSSASSRLVRNVALFAAAALVYWVLASFIPYFYGENIVRLSPFFVGAAGYFLGFRIGTACALAAIIIHTKVFNGLGYDGALVTLKINPAVHVGILPIGMLAGRLRSIVNRLRREIAGHEETESELRDVERRFRDDAFEKLAAGAALRENEARLRLFIEHTSDSILELDPDGNILFANRSLRGGVDAGGIAGKSIFEMIPGGQIDTVKRVLADVVQKKRPGKFDIRIDLYGETAFQSNRVIPVEENGDVVRLLVIGTDVTDRKIAEDALRLSEKRYRNLFDDDVAGDFIAMPGGTVVACNREFARIFGFDSVEDALGVKAPTLFPDEKTWVELLELLGTQKRLVRHEEELRAKDGRAVYVTGNFIGGFDGAGNITEVKGYVLDNTVRKRLEEQLARSRKTVRAAESTASQDFPAPSSTPETILIAEDEPAVSHLIEGVLGNKGYRILLAGDGEAALDVAAAHEGNIDLLITDMVMPSLNGPELAQKLRSTYPALKVLYLSGYIGRASVKIAELGPNTSFVSKPFSPQGLARKIRLLLDASPDDPAAPPPAVHAPRISGRT